MTFPPRARLAAILWLVLAAAVWNVVFDYMIVMAGRRYISAATRSVRDTGSYLMLNDWMRPAIPRAVWTATGVALAIAVFGVGAVIMAVRSTPVSDATKDLACEPSPIR